MHPLAFSTGLGWLVPIVVFGTYVATAFTVDAIHGEGFYAANAWPQYTVTFLSALFLAALGVYLNRINRRDLIDEETGEIVGKAPLHSLLFIPIEYWALIALLSGPITQLEWP